MNKTEITLNEVIGVIKRNNLMVKYSLKRIGFFGSLVHGYNARDIDILIEGEYDYKNLIGFKNELEKLVKKNVDVVIEKFANPIILYRAKKEMVHVP